MRSKRSSGGVSRISSATNSAIRWRSLAGVGAGVYMASASVSPVGHREYGGARMVARKASEGRGHRRCRGFASISSPLVSESLACASGCHILLAQAHVEAALDDAVFAGFVREDGDDERVELLLDVG